MAPSEIRRPLPIAALITGLAAAAFIVRLGGAGAGWLPGTGAFAALYALLAVSAQVPDTFGRRSAAEFLRSHGFAMAVAAVVVLGVAVRLPHLNTELGHAPIDIDENRLAENVRHFFTTGELVHTQIEQYPGLVFWLFAAAACVGYIRLLSSGRAIPPAELPVERFVAWARFANVGVAAGIICLTALIGRRVFNAWTGILAAALVAIAPLSMSTTLVVRNDAGMLLAALAAVYCALLSLEDGRWRWIVAGGAAAGISTAIKYSSVFAIVPVVAAACSEGAPSRRAARAALACAAFGFAIAVTNHFIWTDFPTFLQQLSDQVAITGAGRWSASANPAAMYIAILGGSTGVGAPLLIAAAIFAVYALTTTRARNLIFLAFPVLYMWFMTHRPSQFARWVFPLLPFPALAGVGALVALARSEMPWIARWRGQPLARAAAVVAALALAWQPIAGAATDVSRRLATPTQTLAERWLGEQVARGETVLTEEGWLDLRNLPGPVRRVKDLRRQLDGGVAACTGATWVVVPETAFGHPTLTHLHLVQRFHASQRFGGNTGYDYEIYRVPTTSFQ